MKKIVFIFVIIVFLTSCCSNGSCKLKDVPTTIETEYAIRQFPNDGSLTVLYIVYNQNVKLNNNGIVSFRYHGERIKLNSKNGRIKIDKLK